MRVPAEVLASLGLRGGLNCSPKTEAPRLGKVLSLPYPAYKYSTSWAGSMVNPHGSTRTRPAELALGGSKRGMGPLRVTGTAGTPVEEPPETNAGDEHHPLVLAP